MAERLDRRVLLGLALAGLVALSAPQARADTPRETVAGATRAVRQLVHDPDFANLKSLLERARGVVIVPELVRAGFVIGGELGDAVMLARDLNAGQWSYPAFMTLASGSVGLQIGVSQSAVVLVIMTEKGLNAMLADKVNFGGDASVAAGPVGAAAKAATTSAEFNEDIYAYGKSSGLFVGLSLEGGVLIPDEDANHDYYGEAATTREVVQAGTVQNPDADALRQALAGAD